MNPFSKKLSLVLLSAAMVLAGCTKKPKRPSPGDTVLGRSAGEAGPEGLNPQGRDNLSDTLADPNSLLDARGASGDELRNVLPTVYFDYDSSSVKASERSKLQEAQRYLNEHPEYSLRLEGHCDWRGTAEYNLGLGDRRANAAKQYLTTLGVPSARLESQSKGDLDAVENASEAVMSQDRKVELVLLKK